MEQEKGINILERYEMLLDALKTAKNTANKVCQESCAEEMTDDARDFRAIDRLLYEAMQRVACIYGRAFLDEYLNKQ